MGGQEFNLTFPGEALEELRPTLEQLELEIDEVESKDRISFSVKTSITTFSRKPAVIYIIHLNPEVVNTASPGLDDLRTMAFLEHCLPKAGPWVIMSKGVNALPSQFERFINYWREYRPVRFIPWLRIEQLPPPEEEARAYELADLLGIPVPSSMRREHLTRASPDRLSAQDKQKVIDIMTPLAGSYMGSSDQFFKGLIELTKLPQSWKLEITADWALREEPEIYAGRLVDWAESRENFIPEGEDKTLNTLGEIIEKLMSKCGEGDRNRFLEIARRYGLLDEVTIRRLSH